VTKGDHIILYYSILYYTILYYIILYYTILYYIIYYTKLQYISLYYIIYYTILHYTILLSVSIRGNISALMFDFHCIKSKLIKILYYDCSTILQMLKV